MATPQLSEERITQLSALAAQYIANQREKYSSRAARLSLRQEIAMQGFFPPQSLDQAGLLVLQRERVANPDCYPMLRDMGLDNLPDQSMMAAITFSDVVVLHSAFSEGLLFHELVHVGTVSATWHPPLCRTLRSWLFDRRRVQRHTARDLRRALILVSTVGAEPKGNAYTAPQLAK